MLDPRIPDGLTDILTGWTFDDVCHAHQLLDDGDAARARAESLARDAAAGETYR